MLSVLMGVFGVVTVSQFWGEILLFLVGVSFLFLISGSDLSEVCVSFLSNVDGVGWGLSMLSFWVVSLMLLGSTGLKSTNKHTGWFVMVSGLLLVLLLMSFSFSSYFMFYLSFESCLIPIFVMIIGWGYQPERSQASVYMLLYTIFGSLPLFLIILWLGFSSGSTYMFSFLSFDKGESLFFYIFLICAFLVKFPMYSVHLWLLKAHVEAPVAGSMVLAGVLLKLGGYGLIRVMPMLSASPLVLLEVLVMLSLWGGVITALSCLRQLDMKLLVACSSVVHMSMCISGLLVWSDWGYKGVVGVMVAHGLCSSGLFYLCNVVYERTSSRSMLVNKGLLNLMPGICLWWFLLVSANMAAPPTLNLLSEVYLLVSLLGWESMNILVLSLLSFFSAAYSLYLFSLSQHGVFNFSKSGFHSGRCNEYLVMFLHWVPLNLLILSAYCVMYLSSFKNIMLWL